ncbi:MAG: MFS transporter, partial [Balneolaceae bacterium]
MDYLTFLRTERRFLSFGISFTFFSSFGQTFLISLFVPYFLTDFDLSNAGFGGIYSIATLLSAGVLPWVGRLIDRVPLRWFSLAVACGLAIACLLIALSWHLSLLFSALFLLRLTGQGLCGHTAETAMARFYDDRRGKALSISSLGYPLGEAFLPTLIAAILTWIHWRTVWGGMGILILFLFIPMIWLLAGRHIAGKTNPGNRGEAPESARKSYGIILG